MKYSKTLRSKMIRLSYDKPQLRPKLLPLLVKFANKDKLDLKIFESLSKLKGTPKKKDLEKMVSSLEKEGFEKSKIGNQLDQIKKDVDKIRGLTGELKIDFSFSVIFLQMLGDLEKKEQKEVLNHMGELKNGKAEDYRKFFRTLMGLKDVEPEKGGSQKMASNKKPEVWDKNGDLYARNKEGEVRGPFKDRKKAEKFSKGPSSGIMGSIEKFVDQALEKEILKTTSFFKPNTAFTLADVVYRPPEISEGQKKYMEGEEDYRINGSTIGKFFKSVATKMPNPLELGTFLALPTMGTLVTLAAEKFTGPLISVPLGVITGLFALGSVASFIQEYKKGDLSTQSGGSGKITFKDFLQSHGDQKVTNKETGNKVKITSLPYKEQRVLWMKYKDMSGRQRAFAVGSES